MILRLTVTIFFLSIVIACNDDYDEELKAIDNQIDNRLYEYFENFKEEAALRNIEVDYEKMNIGGTLENIADQGIVGQCQTYQNGNKAIVIDAQYWNKVSALQKEFLVFHELGHCVLDRDHLNEVGADGNCFSIMNSGTACKLDYTVKTRAALLEELFTNL